MLPVSEGQRVHCILRQAVDKRRAVGWRLGHSWLSPEFQCDMAEHARGYRPAAKVLKMHEGGRPWVVLDALLAKDRAFGERSLRNVVRIGPEDVIGLHGRQMTGSGFT